MIILYLVEILTEWEHILPKKKNQTGTIQTAGGTQMKADSHTIHMEIERTCLCITQNKQLLLLFVKSLRKFLVDKILILNHTQQADILYHIKASTRNGRCFFHAKA